MGPHRRGARRSEQAQFEEERARNRVGAIRGNGLEAHGAVKLLGAVGRKNADGRIGGHGCGRLELINGEERKQNQEPQRGRCGNPIPSRAQPLLADRRFLLLE